MELASSNRLLAMAKKFNGKLRSSKRIKAAEDTLSYPNTIQEEEAHKTSIVFDKATTSTELLYKAAPLEANAPTAL